MLAHQLYRDEMDVVGRFITERCVGDESASSIKAKELYEEYRNWCEEGGEYCTSQKVFGGKLTEKGFERKRGTGNINYWIGIEIVTHPDNEPLYHNDNDRAAPSDNNLL